MGRLEGKVALITGAAGGQGVAEAELFAQEGASLILTDVDIKAGQALAEKVMASGGKAQFVHHDVSSEDEWIAAVAAAKRAFGGLHVLVNNAGIRTRFAIENTPRTEWDRSVAVNLTGPLLGMKHAVPLMRESGGGSIINVSSVAGLTAHDDPGYTATKWGLRGLTKTASVEFVSSGIRVNSIHPGQIRDTGFYREGAPGHAESGRASIPMQRQGTPKECADLVLFLASDESSFITGAEIAIDGGYTAGAISFMRSRLRDQFAAAAREPSDAART